MLDFAADKRLHDSNFAFYKIYAQWQLRSRVLSTSTTQVEGSEDAQNPAPGMQKVFQARGISEKVKTITSDNSPNVKAAVELLQVKPCFTHTLNLAMKDVMYLDDVFATPNVKWRILLLCGLSTFVIKENKLCSGLIYLNGELMITGSISSKQVDSTCKQCTIKDQMGQLYI